MRLRLFSPLIALFFATTFVACGSEPGIAGPNATGRGTIQSTVPALDRPMTIAEALKTSEPGPASISGFLFSTSSGMVMAESILESFPPQPGGRTLIVVGVDPASFEMDTANEVSWTNSVVEVSGTVDSGVLYVDGSDV